MGHLLEHLGDCNKCHYSLIWFSQHIIIEKYFLFFLLRQKIQFRNICSHQGVKGRLTVTRLTKDYGPGLVPVIYFVIFNYDTNSWQIKRSWRKLGVIAKRKKGNCSNFLKLSINSNLARPNNRKLSYKCRSLWWFKRSYWGLWKEIEKVNMVLSNHMVTFPRLHINVFGLVSQTL